MNNNNYSVPKEHMETLVSCLDHLQTSGFVTQFKATPAGLLSLSTERIFQSYQVTVIHFYRFEGESSPSDSSILYAIEAIDGEKGTLVDGYGNASDENITNFMKGVKGIHK